MGVPSQPSSSQTVYFECVLPLANFLSYLPFQNADNGRIKATETRDNFPQTHFGIIPQAVL